MIGFASVEQRRQQLIIFRIDKRSTGTQRFASCKAIEKRTDVQRCDAIGILNGLERSEGNCNEMQPLAHLAVDIVVLAEEGLNS